MMPRDQWVADMEAKLSAILLKGYTTKETDPAMLFRMMCNDVRLLRISLADAYDALHRNGKPQATRTP